MHRRGGKQRRHVLATAEGEPFPRDAFDYLWLLDMRPLPPEWLAGWHPVWVSEGSVMLKRVDGAEPPPAIPQRAWAPAR